MSEREWERYGAASGFAMVVLGAAATGFVRAPAQTFVVHGEAAAAQALASGLRARPNWNVTVPTAGQQVHWHGSGVPA